MFGLILFSRSSMGACGLEFGVQGAGRAGLWACSQSLGLILRSHSALFLRPKHLGFETLK